MSRGCVIAGLAAIMFTMVFLASRPNGFQFGSALVLALCGFVFGAEVERVTGPCGPKAHDRKFRREKW
jgi:hypothetical protein